MSSGRSTPGKETHGRGAPFASANASQILASGINNSSVVSNPTTTNSSCGVGGGALQPLTDISNVSALSEQIRLQGECDSLRHELRKVYRRETAEHDRAEEEGRRSVTSKIEADSLASRLADLSILHESRNKQLEESETKCRDLKSQVVELRSAHRGLEEEMVNLATKVTTLGEQAKDKEVYQKRVEELEVQLRNASQDITVSNHYKNAEQASLEKRLANKDAEYNQLQNRYSALKEEVTREAANLAELFEAVMSDSARERVMQSLIKARNGGGDGGTADDSESAHSGKSSDCMDILDALAQMGSATDGVLFAGPTFSALRLGVSRAATWITEAKKTKKRQDEIFSEQQERDAVLSAELQDALASKAEMASQIASLELTNSKLRLQLESCEKERKERHEELMKQRLTLSSTLGCVNDWTAVDAQVGVLCEEREKLQERHVELVSELREKQNELEHQRAMHQLDLEKAVHDYREAAERAVVKLKTSRQEAADRLAICGGNNSEVVAGASSRINESATLSDFRQTEAKADGDRAYNELHNKYKEALDHINRVEAESEELKKRILGEQEVNKAMKEEVDVLNRLNATRLSVRVGNAVQDATTDNQALVQRTTADVTSGESIRNSADDQVTEDSMLLRQVIFSLTCALKGLIDDKKELCAQRKALDTYARFAETSLQQANDKIRFWSAQQQQNRGGASGGAGYNKTPLLIRFRRAAIAVLAGLRIMKLSSGMVAKRRLDSGLTDPATVESSPELSQLIADAGTYGRKGSKSTLRLFFPKSENPALQKPEDLTLPTRYELADPLAMIGSLANQFSAPITRETNTSSSGAAVASSLPSIFRPSLASTLADGLQRILSRGIDTGSIASIGKAIQHHLATVHTQLAARATNNSTTTARTSIGYATPTQSAVPVGSFSRGPSLVSGVAGGAGGGRSASPNVFVPNSVRSNSPLSSTTSPPSEMMQPQGSMAPPTSYPNLVQRSGSGTTSATPPSNHLHGGQQTLPPRGPSVASSAAGGGGGGSNPATTPSGYVNTPVPAAGLQPHPSVLRSGGSAALYGSQQHSAYSTSTRRSQSPGPHVTFPHETTTNRPNIIGHHHGGGASGAPTATIPRSKTVSPAMTSSGQGMAGPDAQQQPPLVHVNPTVEGTSVDVELSSFLEEEFSAEVLNVIKALDSRVSTALRTGLSHSPSKQQQ